MRETTKKRPQDPPRSYPRPLAFCCLEPRAGSASWLREVERELGRVEARQDGLQRDAALALVAPILGADAGDAHEVGI